MIISLILLFISSFERLLNFIHACRLLIRFNSKPFCFPRKPITNPIIKQHYRKPPIPKWVRDEIIRLKAFMPNDGCRKIALTFNRLYQHKKRMTVGKTYVYETIKKHQYEIACLRKKIKLRKPRPYPKNYLWAIDLTQIQDSNKNLYTLFGVLDADTRMCVLNEHKPSFCLKIFIISGKIGGFSSC